MSGFLYRHGPDLLVLSLIAAFVGGFGWLFYAAVQNDKECFARHGRSSPHCYTVTDADNAALFGFVMWLGW